MDEFDPDKLIELLKKNGEWDSDEEKEGMDEGEEEGLDMGDFNPNNVDPTG